ncbi:MULTISPECIES: SulP family inorganic anion transporter [unclassified Streptomyces]|uniref:SulP family inorganic anion transporter n=1 Tax=unclassified Streptomyces TaxID=2593676 RepID=UPI0016610F77|nr:MULTISPECIES: SulP family inorganic anion transporter [unclassified Streptomyces]MBD0708690.1 sulfate transporter [Streptomyces sp. CBMA291]MBD0712911.1 sulfate transporter [Streptomyces sp. CBMA370]
MPSSIPHLRHDFAASLVVFLVALPLCIGVAVASGVPAELGLITGIVGGVVTGLMRGSSLQVSGPAAGLTVLVFEAVRTLGLAALGLTVLLAGVLQVVMGLLRWGRWFRAISLAVVEGMLAGIGLVIVAGQLYSAAGVPAPTSGTARITGLPAALARGLGDPAELAPLAVAAGTVLVIVGWRYAPRPVRAVPGALVAILLAALATALLGLPVATVRIGGVLDAVRLPEAETLAALGDIALLGTALAFALIASAESLFGAAAVDRLHDGTRTDYDKELVAQGFGNTVCGLLGALPMTAVVVRSAANVRAGARTKASRVLHGVWLLLFAALLPGTLEYVPLPALAGVLVHAGWKLIPFGRVAALWRGHRGEAFVLVVTALAIVTVSMLEGVLIGLALSVGKAAWDASHLRIERTDDGAGPARVSLSGNANFLRLPKMLDVLEALPKDRPVELDFSGLHHLDHACRAALETWAARHCAAGPEAVSLHSLPEHRPARPASGGEQVGAAP